MRIINPMKHALSIALLISFIACNLHAATTVTVNTSQDADAVAPGTSPVSTLGGGLITLRSAIQYFNTGSPSQPYTIRFDIPTSDPGYNAGTWTLTPGIPLTDPFIGGLELDTIVVPITITGYTFAGAVYNTATPNTLAQGDNAVLQIVLNGSNYTVGDGLATGNGLHFGAGSSGSTIKGLVINQWLGEGILIDGTNGSINGVNIVGNFIGTDSTGTIAMPNTIGIGISGIAYSCNNTVIGTTAVADRNIIGGSFALLILNNYGLFGASISSIGNSGTSIVNNYIGTDLSGTIALGNFLVGILLSSDSSSTIGGATVSTRNIISGSTILGVELSNCSTITIQGNYVGTDVSGTKALGNLNTGIELDGQNIFGFPSASGGNIITGNLISGNNVGIRVGDNVAPGAIFNTVQNNLIGTDLSGTLALPNTGFGLIVCDQENTFTGNTISGNLNGGVLIYSNIGNNTLATHNFIGTDYSGTKPLGNSGNGIQIGLYAAAATGPSNNTIGQ